MTANNTRPLPFSLRISVLLLPLLLSVVGVLGRRTLVCQFLLAFISPYSMICDAEESGAISPGKSILVEPTSGNTGPAIAFIAAVKGYQVTMPASINIERRILLRAFGAKVVLTGPTQGLNGVVDKANEIVQNTPNAYMFKQFYNMNNVKIHFETTDPELWEDTLGNMDIFVAGHTLAWLCTLGALYLYIGQSCASFLLSWLIEGHGGYLETNPSPSPEHMFIAPDGQPASISYSTTMDMSIIR